MPRAIAGDLFAAGWLTPNAAAAKLGITVPELVARAKRGEIKRKEIAPGTGLHLYDVGGDR